MRPNFVLSGVWEGIRRNLSMTMALVLNTAILLTFIGAAILANRLITEFQKDYEGKLNVSVYACGKFSQAPCDGRTSPAQLQQLGQELRSYPGVTSVTLVTEQQNFNRAQATQPKNVRNLLQPGTFPASYTVKLSNLSKQFNAFNKKFSGNPEVSGVTNQIGAIRKLLDAIQNSRTFSLGIAFVVLVASILLIANTVQVAAAQRRNETSIMRLVGASRWMTELPFLLETLLATLVGGLLAFGLVSVGKFIFLNRIFEVQVANGVLPRLGMNDVLIASGASLIGGLVLAALTAFATLRLYVKL